jgi:hypothetical protein
VESIKKILFFLLAVYYLFLSTGVTLLETHCLCSNSTNVSLFVESDSCHDIVSSHSCCSNEKESAVSEPIDQFKHSCGCDSPIVTYLKLTDHFGEDSNFEYTFVKQLYFDQSFELLSFSPKVLSEKTNTYQNYLSPENHLSGRELINFIHQRKIAPLV